MWKKAVFMFGAVGIIAIVAACDDSSDEYAYPAYGGGGGSTVVCGTYKTCGTCTPVLGCGWCATGNGTGTCADGPDNCSTSPAGWSWNPDECAGSDGGGASYEGGRTIAEASVGSSGDDAGTTSSNDASSTQSSDGGGEAGL